MKIIMTTGEDGLSVTLEADTIEENMSEVDTVDMMEKVLKHLVELGLVIDEGMLEMLRIIDGEDKKE
jgi:hypothetical protein